MRRILISILVLFSIVGIENTNGQCLNETQLFRMFKTSLSDIKTFMSNEGWYYRGVVNDETVFLQDVSVNFQKEEWSNNYGDKLQLFIQNNKIQLVKYLAKEYCYNSIYDFIVNNKNLKQYSFDGGSINEVNQNGIVIHVLTGASIDIESNEIRLFNKTSMNNIIQTVRNKEEEAKRKFAKVNQLIDSLLEAKNYDKAYYVLTQNMDIHKDKRDVLEEKLNFCTDKIQDYCSAKVDSLMSIQKYKEALSECAKFKKYTYIDVYLENLIGECSEKYFDFIISEGDNLANKDLFDEAISKYNEAFFIDFRKDELDSKIEEVKQRRINKVTSDLIKQAKQLEYQKNYRSAINKYEEIFVYDAQNGIAKREINKLNQLLAFLNKRLTYIYDYAEVAPENFTYLKTYLSDELNDYISTKPKGNVNLQYKVVFDTLGTNNSVYELNSTNKTLLSIVDANKVSNYVKPSIISNYHVASSAQLDVKLNWLTQDVSVTSGNKGLKFSNENYKSKSELSSFISSQPFKYGTYQFGIKQKNCNGVVYEDITLDNYNVRGPLNFIYSAVMPGWGMRKVTYGEKGWGTTTTFLLSVGASIGCLIAGAADGNESLMTTGIIAGGFAGAIYVADIFSVIGKGFKNVKRSADIRQKLRNGNIVIKSEKIEVK